MKNSELSNTNDFSTLVTIKFPHLYIEKYDDYLKNIFIDKSLIYEFKDTKNKPEISWIHKFAISHYCQSFANLNDHLYYITELNEHINQKYSQENNFFEEIKFSDVQLMRENTKHSGPNVLELKELKEFLYGQLTNSSIHLKTISKENNSTEINEDLKNLSIYDQENLIDLNNDKIFKDLNNSNLNESISIKLNNTLAIIDTTTIKLTESLSDCQKIILLSGFFASELLQKYDCKIFKNVKNTNISKKRKTNINYFGKFTKKPSNYFTLSRLIGIYSSLYDIINNKKIHGIDINFMADVNTLVNLNLLKFSSNSVIETNSFLRKYLINIGIDFANRLAAGYDILLDDFLNLDKF